MTTKIHRTGMRMMKIMTRMNQKTSMMMKTTTVTMTAEMCMAKVMTMMMTRVTQMSTTTKMKITKMNATVRGAGHVLRHAGRDPDDALLAWMRDFSLRTQRPFFYEKDGERFGFGPPEFQREMSERVERGERLWGVVEERAGIKQGPA